MFMFVCGLPQIDVGEVQMTLFLILTRAAIIRWTTLAVLPLEIAYDVVEDELERRGVEP
jgi:hypothetical protein